MRKSGKYYRIVIDNCNCYNDLGESWFLSVCSFAVCSVSLFPFDTLFLRHCKRYLDICILFANYKLLDLNLISNS